MGVGGKWKDYNSWKKGENGTYTLLSNKKLINLERIIIG